MAKENFFAVAAVTIDGFIARYRGHKSSWTSPEDKKHLHKMEDSADVLVLGRASFEAAKKHLAKRNTIVLTSTVRGAQKKGNAVFLNPAQVGLMRFVKKNGYKKICVLGGRGAFNYCLSKGILDEIFLTIEPIVFGRGIGLFDQPVKTIKFRLVSVKKLNKKGTLLAHYSK